MLDAGIVEIYYDEDWTYEPDVEAAYQRIASRFGRFSRVEPRLDRVR
jgi:hypothetical protein